jgi:hypothetical protein
MLAGSGERVTVGGVVALVAGRSPQRQLLVVRGRLRRLAVAACCVGLLRR